VEVADKEVVVVVVTLALVAVTFIPFVDVET